MFGSKKHPVLTVDVIIPDREGRVLLLRRGNAPFKGRWCLPGGKVDAGESVEDSARREVREEVGLDVQVARVLGIYSRPGRDPRGHYISVALVAHPTAAPPHRSDEATELMMVTPGMETALELAFDHARILSDHWRTARSPDGALLA